MAKFAVIAQRTASTTLSVGVINAPAASMKRIKLYEIIVGSEATPADNAFLWQLQRSTTAGTAGSAVTPQPLDMADAAAVTVAGQAYSVDPTLTANAMLLTLALNQRATFRWVASPGGELVIPATANNGIAIRTPTAGGLVAVTSHSYIEEQ